MSGMKPTNEGPAEKVTLGKGPQDMADRGGQKPNAQITSTRVSLSRTEHSVAQAVIKAGMGEIQVESTRCSLNRAEADPYGMINKNQPRSPLPSRRKS